ncbi:hypothetical protein V6N13_013249 [Hibiscus sabdariffa]
MSGAGEVFGKNTILVFLKLNRARQIVDITAIHGVSRHVNHVLIVRRKSCVIESNPSPHGGRGALPSEGGSPSDLLFLAGGGIVF